MNTLTIFKGEQIIPLKENEKGEILVSGRELHGFLEVGTEYSKWITRMSEYGFTENEDFVVIVKNDENPLGGRPATDHILKLDMAKELAMIQRTTKGKEARQYFLKVEKAWNSPEMITKRAMEILDRQVRSLTLQLETDKPKVVFADAVAASKSSILIGELAKLIKQNGVDIGEKRLFKWLRANGYLISRKGSDYNMPTQRSADLGVITFKETPIVHADGHISVNKTPKVTGKGQQYFINKFLQKLN